MLTTANTGQNLNSSQFLLTFAPAPQLDGKHTVFGQVISGQSIVKKMEGYGSSDWQSERSSTILIKIADCGQLPLTSEEESEANIVEETVNVMYEGAHHVDHGYVFM